MDAKKFETLSHAMNSAFHGGTGVMEQPSPVESPVAPSPDKPMKAPGQDKNKGEDDGQGQPEQQKEEQEQTAAEKQETENLKDLQKKDQPIHQTK